MLIYVIDLSNRVTAAASELATNINKIPVNPGSTNPIHPGVGKVDKTALLIEASIIK